MIKFFINLFKRKKPYKEPEYEVYEEEFGGGTMIKVEANRELSPEEIAQIIAEQITKGRKRKSDNE